MNKYAPIWKELKKKTHCSISANRAFHPRIIKAVINIKYRDVGFKLRCDAEHRKAVLHYDITGSKVRFFLVYFDLYNIESLAGLDDTLVPAVEQKIGETT